MPVVNYINNKPKNAAEALLGEENPENVAKRGYATAQPSTASLRGAAVAAGGLPGTTVSGKPLDYNDIYNTKTEPEYIKTERERMLKLLPPVPTAGAVKATGLTDVEALRAAATAAGGLPTAASAVASPYLNRATSGLNELFGGAAGINKPNLDQLLPSQLESYQSLARLTGTLPTAEAGAAYENMLPSEREKMRATVFAAQNNKPDYRGSGLTDTAVANARRRDRYQRGGDD